MGVDPIVLTGNPANGVSNELIVEAESDFAAVGDRVLLAAGKMHASGVAGGAGRKSLMTPADAEGASWQPVRILFCCRHRHGTGHHTGVRARLIEVVHTAARTGTDGYRHLAGGARDVATIRQIALMSRWPVPTSTTSVIPACPAWPLPQNIMAYPFAIRGERHTYSQNGTVCQPLIPNCPRNFAFLRAVFYCKLR